MPMYLASNQVYRCHERVIENTAKAADEFGSAHGPRRSRARSHACWCEMKG